MRIPSSSCGALASSAAKLGRDSSSSGFGGTGPAGNTAKPVKPATGAATERSARPESTDDRPKRSAMLKMPCWRGERKSASMRSVRCPSWLNETARLAAMKLRPSRALGLVMASVRRPAAGLNQRMRSWVRTARSSSTTGWNGSQAQTSSLETPSGPATRYGNSYCLASASRRSVSVIRFSSIAASPKRQPSSRWRLSTCSASEGVILPSSIRIAPMWRPVRRELPSMGRTLSVGLTSMGIPLSPGARQRLGIANGGMRRRQQASAGRRPARQNAERRHREARLEVGARAHAAVQLLEHVHHAGGEQQADQDRQRRDQADFRERGLERLERRGQHREVGLAYLAVDLDRDRALQGAVIGALGVFEIAGQHRHVDARGLHGEDALLLRGEGGFQLLRALLVLLHGIAEARDHLVRLRLQALAQALHFGRGALVGGMV